MAERTGVWGYLIFSTMLSGVIFPLAVAWTWGGGWLAQLEPGFSDFAGSGVVHMLGGVAALIGVMAVGPRSGRWEKSLADEFVPHNVPSSLGGLLILWMGWVSE